MKNILCFGDSNTWGYIPGNGKRYAPDVRWTGIVAQELGNNYHIIEDGLNGRTTGYDIVWSPWRNGLKALPYALLAQKPLDLLVISLGINDILFTDAYGSAKSVLGLYKQACMVQALPDAQPVFTDGVKILIIAPMPLHPNYDIMYPSNNKDSYEKSCQYAEAYQTVAKENGLFYLNAGDYAEASAVDCVHMEEGSHKKLGLAIAAKIKDILG